MLLWSTLDLHLPCGFFFWGGKERCVGASLPSPRACIESIDVGEILWCQYCECYRLNAVVCLKWIAYAGLCRALAILMLSLRVSLVCVIFVASVRCPRLPYEICALRATRKHAFTYSACQHKLLAS